MAEATVVAIAEGQGTVRPSVKSEWVSICLRRKADMHNMLFICGSSNSSTS